MFTLIRELGLKQALQREFIPFSAAFLIAELAYKFKSFALECAAFLVTWYVLSLIQSAVLGRKDV
jgi:hypothetical protein